MRRIYIFTEEYHGALARRLPEAASHNFGGVECLVVEDGGFIAAVLAEIAAEKLGANEGIEGLFKGFLEENGYIHLDAFIRICLEDAYA
ncbi:MAG: hypothetical protein LBE55_00550 [Clostridiales bacterium]|nr:hypothetical protein [Clostridiales bacterium]